jgi:hypothetical protein
VERRRQAESCSSGPGKRQAPLPPDFQVSISSNTSPKLRHAAASDGTAADGISRSSPTGTSSYASAAPSLRSDGSDTTVTISVQPAGQFNGNHLCSASRAILHMCLSLG